ncbi:C-type lectin domain family 4 member F-like isoform X3 [Hemibagrus wyckioides]|uniref:C-type lectin domain family 4 member F-like isoform X3 n=1 Tax=Hemibagrus wyckioides TaxID=337641 RepID=UPI00266CB5AB|nr:C-type lectin domain family 4 member F-like isoform X3 [Hemibagrus wyckioides]
MSSSLHAKSQDYCVEKGGHLVIITSQPEQDFVVSQIRETHWIGLNDLETEGQWMWVNNQPLKETGVTFWYSAPEGPNQPDNWKIQDPSGENCAALGDENGRRTEEDDYVNTQNWHPDMSDHTELKDKKETRTIFISSFGLILIVGALSALCAVGILYHNKGVSYEILSEQYANVTRTLMMQENKSKEIEKLHEALKHMKMELQQVQEDLAACSANQNKGQCEEGWKSLGLKCYYFSCFKLDWTQSRDYCVEKGGHLVIITSQIEQDFVASQTEETHWIGLNDLETEGQWMWVNNQPLKETGVTFWYRHPDGISEPDNWKVEDPAGENCAALGYDKWFDASCRKLKQFICEI